MDDDIFVDFNQLKTVLKRQYPDLKNDILGYKHVGLVPQRRAEDKWFVSHADFPGATFPDFVSGWAYVTSQDVARRVVEKANEGHGDIKTGVTWIDDLWITGIVAPQAGVSLLTLNAFYTPDVNYLRCCQTKHDLDDDDDRKWCDFIVGPSDGDPELIESLGRMSRRCQEQGCIKRKWPNVLVKTCIRAVDPFEIPKAKYSAKVMTINI